MGVGGTHVQNGEEKLSWIRKGTEEKKSKRIKNYATKFPLRFLPECTKFSNGRIPKNYGRFFQKISTNPKL
jgi:hypothetical protein